MPPHTTSRNLTPTHPMPRHLTPPQWACACACLLACLACACTRIYAYMGVCVCHAVVAVHLPRWCASQLGLAGLCHDGRPAHACMRVLRCSLLAKTLYIAHAHCAALPSRLRGVALTIAPVTGRQSMHVRPGHAMPIDGCSASFLFLKLSAHQPFLRPAYNTCILAFDLHLHLHLEHTLLLRRWPAAGSTARLPPPECLDFCASNCSARCFCPPFFSAYHAAPAALACLS